MDAEPTWQRITGCYSNSVANGDVWVTHSLGVVPDDFSYSTYSDMNVYATADDRRAWTPTRVLVRGTATSKQFNLHLVKF
jgi:hypothetical protein